MSTPFHSHASAGDRKRAALRLALLRRSDRNWVLSQLEPAQRQEMQAMLPLLLNLGAHRLAELEAEIEALLSAPSVDQTLVAKASPAAGLPANHLERVSADELRPVLRELPVECVSLVSSRVDPSRKHIMAAVLRPFERDMPIQQPVRRELGVSEAFVEALVEVVEMRLQSDSPVAAFERRPAMSPGGGQ